jgi:diacylglycerol kinase
MRAFINSFIYAGRGIWFTLKNERNFKIHFVGVFLAIAAGVYLGISAVEWSLVILAIGLVLVAELINTAVERLGDKAAGRRQDPLVGKAKDIAAGAVLLAALIALAIGIIILFIPLFRRWF